MTFKNRLFCCVFFFCAISEMEIIQEGRNFRLIQDSELSDVLVILGRYLPESLKVYNLLTSPGPVFFMFSLLYFCLFIYFPACYFVISNEMKLIYFCVFSVFGISFSKPLKRT